MTQKLTQQYTWAVIGAGPAGILAVGRLLDQGITAKQILWIDPNFNAGAIGSDWFEVPSNTKVSLFTQFFNSTIAFNYANCPYQLDHLVPDAHCPLGEIVKPLVWISQQLCQQVNSISDTVNHISKAKHYWQIDLDTNNKTNYLASNIILATGATAKLLTPDQATKHLQTIELSTALTPTHLTEIIQPNDTVIVYGASHSAILVIKNLLALNCRVINFYKHPIKYAIYQSDHILYDNTGLKGVAADFAKSVIEPENHPKLIRCHLSEHKSIDQLLQQANKVVYAIGFQTSHQLPKVQAVNLHDYDCKTGIIAKGLYGFGIAFPEQVTDQYGITEYSVGLAKFSTYLTKALPLWLQYSA